MYCVYVLKSLKDGIRYVGQTSKPADVRTLEHNRDKSRFTRGHQPWQLVYSEQYSTRAEAATREKFLKSGQGRKWLNENLNI